MKKEDILWQALLDKNPNYADLRYIVYYAPEEYKAKASEQLLKQNPSNTDLGYIIYYMPLKSIRLRQKRLYSSEKKLLRNQKTS